VLVLGHNNSLLALKHGLAVLVELERGDDDVGGVDRELDLLGVSLFPHDFLNVDAPSSAVDGNDLTFTALVGATHDLDLITLAHGDGANFVLLF